MRQDATPWRIALTAVQSVGAMLAVLSPAVPLKESVMGGRHASPKHGTDVFMAVVVLALLLLLAAVVIPAAVGG